MRLKRALSFDDVMLVPRLSKMNRRADADLSTKVAGIPLQIPIIAANMSSVCESEMAIALAEMGGLGIIHRMCSVEEQAKLVSRSTAAAQPWIAPNVPEQYPVGFSFGIGSDWRDRIEACRKAGGSICCLDVAHGHHERVLELLHKYFGIYRDFPIIIGQVATPSAVRDILRIVPTRHHGTVAIKTSIGGGSLCTTRIKTGFGIPTLQAIMDIATEFPDVSLIGDGGIKESGDIVKSMAAGADAVMLGNLLAGTDEAPGGIITSDNQLHKVYRGSASFADKALRGEETRNVEGEETLLSYKGSVKRVIENLLYGIRSGFSYGGAHTIAELQDDIEFVEITIHGYHESLPHGK